jgi:glycosyltransferase involved in cell wall biosynthesis
LISVVIPCFNGQMYLEQAIRSAQNQTLPPAEVIVVDDCSTDDSVKIAERCGAVVLRTSTNSGHATARNLGIGRARGDTSAWVDADDYWEPNHLEVVGGLLDRHSDAAVAFSKVRFVGSKNGVSSDQPCDDHPARVFKESFLYTVPPAMSVLTRRSALQEVGGFAENIRYAPDFDLWLRMARRFLFVSTKQVTSNYRWHTSQISASPHRQWRSVYEARLAMIDRLRADGELDTAHECQALLLQQWENDLSRSLQNRQLSDYHFYASLISIVPWHSALTRRHTRLAMLPQWLIHATDRLPSAFKKVLLRAALPS